MSVYFGNWRTTLAGLLAATANIIIAYLEGKLDAKAFAVSFGIAAIGYFSKDAATGSRPGDNSYRR